MLHLIVDIGTSHLKISIFDNDSHLIDARSCERKLSAIFDPDHEFYLMCQLIQSLSLESRGISSIAVSSMLGWVCIDKDGKAITPCYSYMNTYPEQCDVYKETHENTAIHAITGRPISPEWAVFLLVSLKQYQPRLYNEVEALLSFKDYINFKLSSYIATDTTTAAYTMGYNVFKRCWSSSLIQSLDLEEKHFPTLKTPDSILGPINHVIAVELGLPSDTLIITGSVDGSTALLGAGAIKKGIAVSVMGTTEVLFITTDDPWLKIDTRLIINPHVIQGLWLVGGPMGFFGGTLDWQLCQLARESINHNSIFSELQQIPPGSDGAIVFPSLEGERAPFWNSSFVGTYWGLRSNHSSAHLYNAVLEANGYATKHMLNISSTCGIYCNEIIAIGGGARNDHWLQTKANITGKPILRDTTIEATTMGALHLTFLALGMSFHIQHEGHFKRFSPELKHLDVYEKLYKQYMTLHDEVSEIYCLKDGKK